MRKKLSTIVLLMLLHGQIQAATEVRLATHSSFELPENVLAQFERQHDAKITVLKLGDGNELLNKLVISQKRPIADAVYGLDNANIHRALSFNLLAAAQPESQKTWVKLPNALAVNYAFVGLNYDKNWFAKNNVPLPKTLHDLTLPQYKNLLVSPNPNTSTPAMAFLLANIGGLGEEGAFNWWAAMRQNGVKITQSWTDAYYTEFTLNGGSRPIMVGYGSSPAAEVFYSNGKLSTPNMGNLFLVGGTFRQIEGAAVLNGAQQPELAAKLVQYLQSQAAQNEVATNMWVYPAVQGVMLPRVMLNANVPAVHFSPNDARVAAQQKSWAARWTKVVLK